MQRFRITQATQRAQRAQDDLLDDERTQQAAIMTDL